MPELMGNEETKPIAQRAVGPVAIDGRLYEATMEGQSAQPGFQAGSERVKMPDSATSIRVL